MDLARLWLRRAPTRLIRVFRDCPLGRAASPGLAALPSSTAEPCGCTWRTGMSALRQPFRSVSIRVHLWFPPFQPVATPPGQVHPRSSVVSGFFIRLRVKKEYTWSGGVWALGAETRYLYAGPGRSPSGPTPPVPASASARTVPGTPGTPCSRYSATPIPLRRRIVCHFVAPPPRRGHLAPKRGQPPTRSRPVLSSQAGSHRRLQAIASLRLRTSHCCPDAHPRMQDEAK